ncbi:MAG TPA: hypothetical protein VHO24_12770 [Opitutaceae bacterium]|nr:hypothetical protein [Opitutaceae bacterium]
MSTNISAQKKAALRLAFFYPGIVLGLVIFFGGVASSLASRMDVQIIGNALRGMTAFSLLALSLAYLGYLQLKKCL